MRKLGLDLSSGLLDHHRHIETSHPYNHPRRVKRKDWTDTRMQSIKTHEVGFQK
jgi:hypothetical protein